MTRLSCGLLLLVTIASSTVLAFEPPTAQERAEALGDLANVTPELRQLLTPNDDFDLISMPEPGDWLDEQSEPGQTFDEYLTGGAHRPDAIRRVIYLLPIGEFVSGASPALETLRRYATGYFQMEAKLLPPYQPDAKEFEPRVNPQTKRAQLLTRSILKFLETRLPADAFCMLGITMQDLYPLPSWNYVFGEASVVRRVGIYSFARFDADFFHEQRTKDYRRLILWRSCKVLVHETGHMFGLQHCIYYGCVMNGSNNLAEADAQPLHLCPVCLRKLQRGIGFDATKRYKEQARYYRKQKWDKDADWCERQVKKAAAR